MRFHLPYWVYNTLAAVGGFGVIFREVLKPLLTSAIKNIYIRHDKPVWDALLVPKMKGMNGGMILYYSTEEAPYSVEELAAKVNRSNRSVLSSLHRLEERGKAKEVPGGWQRREK